MGSIIKKVADTAKVISLPDTYLKLKSLLDEPDFNMADIGILISQDPGLTLRLLKLVNSSLYSRTVKIETVSHAVSIIGTQQIHDLVLATCVAETFKGMSSKIMTMGKFWRKSVYCGVTARLLSSIHRTTSGERLFVCGLLHDIGHLIMYQSIPEECQEAILKSKRKGVPLYKIERDLFGFDYAKLGGGMMRQWGLPVSLWEPVQYHVEPQMAEEYPEETSLTHLSALFTGAIEDKENFNEGIWQADPATWDATKLTAEQCQTIQGDAEKQVNEIMNAFFG